MAGSSGGWFTIKDGSAAKTKGKIFISLSAVRTKLAKDSSTSESGWKERLVSLDEARAKLAELRGMYEAGVESVPTKYGKTSFDGVLRDYARAEFGYGGSYERGLPSGMARKALPPDPGPQDADYSKASPLVPRVSDEELAAYAERPTEYFEDPDFAYSYRLDGEDKNRALRRAVAKVREIAAKSDVAMRMPNAVLAKILETGFQNQHATGKSKGTLNPALRAKAENTMFGIDPDSDPEAFPIYGYLSLKGASAMDGDDQYGAVRVIMRDSVRARTTIAVGDTLTDAVHWKSYRPSPIDGVGPGVFGPSNAIRLLGSIESGASDQQILDDHRYFEAQIHGPTTAADIARVSFPKPPTKAMQKQLASLGIAWDVYDAPAA